MNLVESILSKHKRSQHDEAFTLFQQLINDKEQLEQLRPTELSQLLRVASLCCYFIGKPQLGLKLIDLYYLLRTNPTRNDCFDNLSFYISTVGQIDSFGNSPTNWIMEDENGVKLSMTNASSFSLKGKQYLLVRVINYQIRPSGYHFLDGSTTVKSRYVICQIVDNQIDQFNFITVKSDHEVFSQLADKYQGLEDLRPLVWRNRVKVFGSSADVHPGKIGIFMADLDPDNLLIENVVPLIFSNGQVEKNWLPFISDDKLYCIYSFNPLIIIRVYANGISKEVKRTHSLNDRYSLIGHRGGSIADIGTGYLIMTHYISTEPLFRYYYRRFVLMDYQFNLVAMSKPFCFEKKYIEYSLCLFQRQPDLFDIYYSVTDWGVRIVRLTRVEIDQMLVPIDQYLDISME